MSQFPPDQPPQSPGSWQQPNTGYQQSGQYPPNQSPQPQWPGQPSSPQWPGQPSQPQRPGQPSSPQWSGQPSSPQWPGQPSSQPEWQGQSSQSPQPEWQQSNPGYQQSGQYPPQPMQPGMYPPPQRPAKKSRRGLWIAIGVVAVVLLAICVGVVAIINSAAKSVQTSLNTTLTSVATSLPTSAATANNSQHFKVGQVVKVNDTWQVTVNSVKTSNGDQFLTPAAGNAYFIVDVTVKNLSGQQQTISSAINFSLQDATGQKYTETILTGETPPDGTVGTNSLLRGQLTYEVPTSQSSFTFNFEPDIVSGGQTVWDLQK